MLYLIVTAIALTTAPLPGSTGPLRYFASIDDGTHLWLVDWTVDGKDYGIITSDRRWAETVLAYEKKARGRDEVMYAAPKDIGVITFMSSGETLHEGTLRKQWKLGEWRGGKEQITHFVEITAPAGSRSASDVVDAYVAAEGAKPATDQGTVPVDAEKTLANACGGKISVKAAAAAKAGMMDRVRTTSAGIAKLCEDADYKSVIAKMTELNFTASGAPDTRVTTRGKAIDVALGTTPLNTPATVQLWLKNHL